MSDDPRPITDDMQISELTVGEFKQLMQQILQTAADSAAPEPAESPQSNQDVTVRRKSLDEFMADLNK
jgi:Flp pilus assembly protein TadG